jgi:hypothetical protein
MISFIDDETKDEILVEVMKRLISLSEEQAKLESAYAISQLIRTIGQANNCQLARLDKATQYRKVQQFHRFWLDHTAKAIKSNSLVLRLFGWDQIHELIKESNFTRPLAESYIVRGAGNDDANGHYKYASRDNDGVITYTKQPTKAGMPLLTLFRCPMRNKSKWWFISQVDKEKPGTEKDIDYYQHKSTIHEEREPSCRGWIVAPQQHGSPGREPAPILIRQGQNLLNLSKPLSRLFDDCHFKFYFYAGKLLPDGTTEQMFLSHLLPQWALHNEIIELVFTSSPHREVIARSVKLITFLAEAGALTEVHIKLIWKTGASLLWSHSLLII